MKIEIIRTNGQRETIEVSSRIAFTQIEHLIGAKQLNTVNLRDGRIMFVDEHGYECKAVEDGPVIELVPVKALKPVNPEATKIYHSVCLPGTSHQIVGDVAIALDADFA